MQNQHKEVHRPNFPIGPKRPRDYGRPVCQGPAKRGSARQRRQARAGQAPGCMDNRPATTRPAQTSVGPKQTQRGFLHRHRCDQMPRQHPTTETKETPVRFERCRLSGRRAGTLQPRVRNGTTQGTGQSRHCASHSISVGSPLGPQSPPPDRCILVLGESAGQGRDAQRPPRWRWPSISVATEFPCRYPAPHHRPG